MDCRPIRLETATRSKRPRPSQRTKPGQAGDRRRGCGPPQTGSPRGNHRSQRGENVGKKPERETCWRTEVVLAKPVKANDEKERPQRGTFGANPTVGEEPGNEIDRDGKKRQDEASQTRQIPCSR